MRKTIGGLMQGTAGVLVFLLAGASDMGRVTVAAVLGWLPWLALLAAAGHGLAQYRPSARRRRPRASAASLACACHSRR